MNNILFITFNEEATDGDRIDTNVSDPGVSISSFGQTFQYTPRYGGAQIQVWDPNSGTQSPYTTIVGEYTAMRYAEFYELDYSQNGFIQVSRVGNTVRLELIEGFEFDGPTAQGIDVTFAYDSNVSNFNYTTDGFEENDFSPCGLVAIDFDFTSNVDKIKRNGVLLHDNWNQNQYNTFVPREDTNYFEFTDYNGTTRRYPEIGITGVHVLTPINISILTIPANNGTTVVFNHVNNITQGFENQQLEFSLDGINFIGNPVFPNQADGDYTIYIRDQFGCTIQKDYTILNSIVRQPYHYFSEANSIDMVLQENIDNCSVFKNPENSFNNNSLSEHSYCQDILFNLCDDVKMQFKTNFSNVSVTLRKEGESDILIPSIQQTLYLNRFQSLDGNIYSYAPGKMGIYFTTGNEYNELGDIIGTFILNGNIPLMGKTGNIIQIQGYGSFIIEDVLFDENVNRYAIIINYQYNGFSEVAIISSTFDILPFEVFEFLIDWDIYGTGLYDVVVHLTDDNFEDVYYISENISIEEEHPNTLHIRAYNENNRDIFYKFGIQHIMRAPYLDVELDVNSESSINIGDFTSELISSNLGKKDNYIFDELPDRYRTKLLILLSREFCFINGLGYIKGGEPNIEHVANTNLALISQEMVRTNINYNNNNQNQVPTSAVPLPNIPAFIGTGSKNIKE